LVDERDQSFGAKLRQAIETIFSREHFEALKGAPYEPRGLDAAQAIAKGILSIATKVPK
jgi:hypothetical protein